MGYERSKFGDGSAEGAGNVVKQVSNHFGPRDVGKTNGITNSDGFVRELTFDLDSEVLNAQEFALNIAHGLPAGCRIEDVFLDVAEAFDTDAVADVGTDGTEATNGVTLASADLNAVGVYDVTGALSGTWAAAGGVTADIVAGIVYGGTATTSGKARLVLRYFRG